MSDAVLGLDLGHLERGVEREVDVVAEEEVAALRAVAEGREAVAAGLRGLEDLRVVREIEGAAHAAHLDVESAVAAAFSARRAPPPGVSAAAIT